SWITRESVFPPCTLATSCFMHEVVFYWEPWFCGLFGRLRQLALPPQRRHFPRQPTHQRRKGIDRFSESFAGFGKPSIEIDRAADFDLKGVKPVVGRRMTLQHISPRIGPIVGRPATLGMELVKCRGANCA